MLQVKEKSDDGSKTEWCPNKQFQLSDQEGVEVVWVGKAESFVDELVAVVDGIPEVPSCSESFHGHVNNASVVEEPGGDPAFCFCLWWKVEEQEGDIVVSDEDGNGRLVDGFEEFIEGVWW